MAYFANDTESEYYRDLSFDHEKFLQSHQIGELVIMKADIKDVKYESY